MILDTFHILKNTLFLSLLFLSLFTACGGSSDDADETSTCSAAWKTASAVASTKGNATVQISGTLGTAWTAEITDGVGWCSFDYSDYSDDAATTGGTVTDGINVCYVYFRNNSTAEQRVATILFTFADGGKQTLTLTQQAAGQVVVPTMGTWAETPSAVENKNYQYVTHYAKLNGKEVRNYSMCFDKTRKVALWVAYPLHSAYVGGVSRTDAWDFDPYVPEEAQANLFKSYRGSYDRGHQLPSGDRTGSAELNEQTFYFSNMTPQLNKLNQQMWMHLESEVRNQRCSDTLYVVTGAYYDAASTASTTDYMGGVCPLPTHYFKVLLRTKTGSTGKAIQDCTAMQLKSIGFWVEHKNYGDIQPPRTICMSVEAIEKKTGFTFFPTVDPAVKQDYNTSDWNINWN
ncbi:MAG: DNA/RNA non-specific endonuclease [Bacteroides sp.]|nr:DNA/RNA non-specific endonuclease [Bacteroides sp.]